MIGVVHAQSSQIRGNARSGAPSRSEGRRGGLENCELPTAIRWSPNPRCATGWGIRRGLTLVEVLASLLILGGAVSMMLTAQMRSLEQVSRSRWGCEAEDLARELIADWQLAEADMASPEQGQIGDGETWRFDRMSRQVNIEDGASLSEITLTLTRRTGDENAEPWSRSFTWLMPHKKGGK